jgi:hypothetical protein
MLATDVALVALKLVQSLSLPQCHQQRLPIRGSFLDSLFFPPSLYKHHSLAYNRLGKRGAASIATAIGHNKTLVRLR